MAEIIGPVACFLVETAALSSRYTGELFQILADELSTESEQMEFLSIIE